MIGTKNQPERRIGGHPVRQVDPTDKARMRAAWMIGGGAGLVFVAAVAAMFLFNPTRHAVNVAPDVVEKSPPPKAAVPVNPASSLILGGQAANAPVHEEVAPVSLGDIAKAETSQMQTATGKLYGKESAVIEIDAKPLAADAPELENAREAMRQYQAAKSIEDKLRYVYRPERTEARMRKFYEQREQADPALGKLLRGMRLKAADSELTQLIYDCPQRLNGVVTATFHHTRGGWLLLDWDSFTAWGEMKWPDFKARKSIEPILLRAIAEASDYYNYEFSDRARYLSLKLRSPDGSEVVHAYLPRRSGLGKMLEKELNFAQMEVTGRPAGAMLVTARLSFPFDARSDHCTQIKQLIINRWVLFDGEDP